MPPIRWPAILAGAALAVALALLSALALPPISAAVASFFGLFVSGLLAGKLAKEGGVYHGALVGAGYVLCEALGNRARSQPDRGSPHRHRRGHRVRRVAARLRGARRVALAALVFF